MTLGDYDEKSLKQFIGAAKLRIGAFAVIPEEQRKSFLEKAEAELRVKQSLLADLNGVEKRIKGDR